MLKNINCLKLLVFMHFFYIFALLKKLNLKMEKIILESKIVEDEYTSYVCGNYDLTTNGSIINEIPIFDEKDLETFNWNIGIILGNSGSGKSTILKKLGEVVTPIYKDRCVISQFDMLSPEEACELLHGVGLSSIPTWLQKPWELSNGEKARLDIAWQIANTAKDGVILVDEFTSVINRASAKSMSYSVQRYLRKHEKKIILASCHFDIIDWIRPDWVYNLNKSDGEDNDIERLVYNDDEEYVSYAKVNDAEILSEPRDVVFQ